MKYGIWFYYSTVIQYRIKKTLKEQLWQNILEIYIYKIFKIYINILDELQGEKSQNPMSIYKPHRDKKLYIF